jgi:hypothetical protein
VLPTKSVVFSLECKPVFFPPLSACVLTIPSNIVSPDYAVALLVIAVSIVARYVSS